MIIFKKARNILIHHFSKLDKKINESGGNAAEIGTAAHKAFEAIGAQIEEVCVRELLSTNKQIVSDELDNLIAAIENKRLDSNSHVLGDASDVRAMIRSVAVDIEAAMLKNLLKDSLIEPRRNGSLGDWETKNLRASIWDDRAVFDSLSLRPINGMNPGVLYFDEGHEPVRKNESFLTEKHKIDAAAHKLVDRFDSYKSVFSNLEGFGTNDFSDESTKKHIQTNLKKMMDALRKRGKPEFNFNPIIPRISTEDLNYGLHVTRAAYDIPVVSPQRKTKENDVFDAHVLALTACAKIPDTNFSDITDLPFSDAKSFKSFSISRKGEAVNNAINALANDPKKTLVSYDFGFELTPGRPFLTTIDWSKYSAEEIRACTIDLRKEQQTKELRLRGIPSKKEILSASDFLMLLEEVDPQLAKMVEGKDATCVVKLALSVANQMLRLCQDSLNYHRNDAAQESEKEQKFESVSAITAHMQAIRHEFANLRKLPSSSHILYRPNDWQAILFIYLEIKNLGMGK